MNKIIEKVFRGKIDKCIYTILEILSCSLIIVCINELFPFIGEVVKKLFNMWLYEKWAYSLLIFLSLNICNAIFSRNLKKAWKFFKLTSYFSTIIILAYSYKIGLPLLVLIIILMEIENLLMNRDDETLLDTSKINIEEKIKEKIYGSRQSQFEYFTDVLYSKGENKGKLILVDGEWGIGKSYFTNLAFEAIGEDKFFKIEVDILLFNDRAHIIEHTLDELRKILEENGIRSSGIKEIKKALQIVTEGFRLKISHIFDSERLDKIEKDLKKQIEKLDKPIFIVVDNLERVINKEKIVDALGFLHKLNEIIAGNSKIIVLADSSKIKRINEISIESDSNIDKTHSTNVLFDKCTIKGTYNLGNDYLDKFFDEKIYLQKTDKIEILEKLEEDIISKFKGTDFENPYEHFIKAFKSFDNLYNRIWESKQYDTETINFMRRAIFDINEKLENSRNIEKIIDESFALYNTHTNIFAFKGTYNNDIYIKQIVLTTILKKFFPALKDSIFTEDDIDSFINNYNKESSEIRIGSTFHNVHFLLSYFGLTDELADSVNEKDKKKIISTYFKLVKKAEDIFETEIIKKIKKLENKSYIIEDENEAKQIIKAFIYYKDYLDVSDDSKKKYLMILNKFTGKIIARDEEWTKIISEKDFLEFDKGIKKNSILYKLNRVIDYNNIIRNALYNQYFEEFLNFSYKYLNYKENIIYVSQHKFLEEFPLMFSKKYPDSTKNIDEIIKYITKKMPQKLDKKLKHRFLCLLVKLSKLEIKFKEEEEINFTYKEQLFKEVEIYNRRSIKNSFKNSFRWIEKSKTIDELLMKSLRKDLYPKLENAKKINRFNEKYIDYYNEKLEELINLVPKDFYKSIIVSLSNYNDIIRNLILTMEIMDKLLEGKVNSFLNEISPLLNDRNQYLDKGQGLTGISLEFEGEMADKYYNVINPIREVDSNVYEKIQNRYGVITKNKRPDDEIIELIRKLDEDTFKEVDFVAEQKHINEGNKSLFRDATGQLKEQYRVLIEIDLYYLLQQNKEYEIEKKIREFFDQFDSYTATLQELIYTSIFNYWNQLPYDELNHFGAFLQNYKDDRDKNKK